MRAFHYADYALDLRPGSRYPLKKFSLLVDGVLKDRRLGEYQVVRGMPADRNLLALAHTSEYINRIEFGPLEEAASREMGFLWSPALFLRGSAIVGCSVAAAHEALTSGLGVVLGGGAHHAFSDRGRGYCIFNDIAVVARKLLLEGLASRIAIIDCDVHQGDGTASILSGDSQIFTSSIHGRNNYPFQKMQSSLDIELEENCGDQRYLIAVEEVISQSLKSFRPDFLIYVAGADPYFEDRLGKLRISLEALRERDEMVFSSSFSHEIPTLLVFGGGYCDPIEKTVECNLQSIRVAREQFLTFFPDASPPHDQGRSENP